MSSDWIHNWSINKIKSVICASDDLLNPFTIHNVIKKINKRYPNAHAYYTSCSSRNIRRALTELVDNGVLSAAYEPVKKKDGSITETYYSFIY